MAMACAFPLAVSSTTAVLLSSSTSCNTTVSQRIRGRVGGTSTARENDVSREAGYASRREVLSLATLSLLLFSGDKAQAKDIPLFGIRKQLESAEKAVAGAEKAVETEVKKLASQGGKELEAVSASVKEAVNDIDAEAAVSPLLQAGGVVGAELVAVLVASTVVNGLVSVPSK